MAGWETFFAAQLGASAALAGLVLVGASINLDKIMSSRRHPNRVLEALVLLFTVMALSSLFLVPDQPMTSLGSECLAIGFAAWAVIGAIHLHNIRRGEPEYRRLEIAATLLAQTALAPLLVGAALLLAGRPAGADWFTPGVLLSYFVVFVNAWVLLVEINR